MPQTQCIKATKSFRKGLKDEIRRAIVFQTANTLKEAYDLARKFENDERSRAVEDDNIVETIKDLLKVKDSSFSNPRVRVADTVICQLCSENHSAKDCWKNPGNVVCQLCERRGHTAVNCFRNNTNNTARNFNGGQGFRTPNPNHYNNNSNGYRQSWRPQYGGFNHRPGGPRPFSRFESNQNQNLGRK